jgi:hypothetical protein
LAYANPSGSVVHATLFVQLKLSMIEHLFPGAKLPALTPDQHRIVDNEVVNALMRARAITDSQHFADALAQVRFDPSAEAPADTMLGAAPKAGPGSAPTPPHGQYV